MRRARGADSGISEAVIAAVADLLLPGQTPPLVVAIEDVVVAETSLVVVVVESGDGHRHAGAAVLEGGRAYGIAAAAWAALSDVS